MNLEGIVDKRSQTARKGQVITLQTAMTKKGRQFFKGKIRVTPSVAVLGDTNPNDATGPIHDV